LAGLNDRFCRRPDTVEIGFGVCSINNESRIDVDPYANNILRAMASRGPTLLKGSKKLTTVARIKIKTEGSANGRFTFPVDLRLRNMVPTALKKSVTAIPDL
jgi:hypothetical protein